MATGIRKTGEFCWINMLTPQPEQACAFFGTLLGWTYAEMPGMGSPIDRKDRQRLLNWFRKSRTG